MTLREDMATDVTAVFLSTADFAVSAKIYADGAGSGVALTVMPGDPDVEWSEEQDLGQLAGRRTQTFLVGLAAVKAALSGRLPRRNDTLGAMNDDALSGTWVIVRALPDDGGGCLLYCVLSDDVQVDGIEVG